MKNQIEITNMELRRVGPDVFNRCREIYPEGSEADWDWFGCRLLEEDPRAQEILEVLSSAGFEPNVPFIPLKPNQISLNKRRIYETADFESARLLVCVPQMYFGSEINRTASNLVTVDIKEMRIGEELGYEFTTFFIIIPARIKECFEAANLRHVVIRPVFVEEDPHDEYAGQYWEVTTDLTLPRVSPTLRLLDDYGQPSTTPGVRGLFYESGEYADFQLRYRAEDLAKIDDFDLAHGFEGCVSRMGHPVFVASNKFYRFCTELNLKMKWETVVIEE